MFLSIILILSGCNKKVNNVEIEYVNVKDSVIEGANSFKEGLAAVKIDGVWNYIDTDGNIIIETDYDRVYSFNNGYAIVENDDKYGYIDTEGNIVIDIIYDEVGYNHYYVGYSEGIVQIGKDGYWGYFNISGEAITDLEFNDAYSFNEGLGLAYTGNSYVFINSDGEVVIGSFD